MWDFVQPLNNDIYAAFHCDKKNTSTDMQNFREFHITLTHITLKTPLGGILSFIVPILHLTHLVGLWVRVRFQPAIFVLMGLAATQHWPLLTEAPTVPTSQSTI